jgi:hypothetical protein
MVGCFAVGEAQRSYIERHTGLPLALDRFDYFVVCLTNDWDATLREGGYLGQFPAPHCLGRQPANDAGLEFPSGLEGGGRLDV